MKLPLRIAKALLKLSNGAILPGSAAKHSVIEDLIQENILFRTGKIRKTLGLTNQNKLELYLYNRFSIKELKTYVAALEESETSRASLVDITGDSKIKSVRTFKGFLVNSFNPVPAILNSEKILLEPREGIFHFIYDFENFIPATNVTIVGVENSENFRRLKEQAYLFKDIRPLFISRYPQNQSKDFISWMKSIPNNYLHFGDYDMAGIGIYLNEYKKHFPEKSRFFIPDGLEEILKNSGSRERYNAQKINFSVSAIEEGALLKLINLLHKYKKGLDQEILIK
ncbi:hypothetical protein SAMN05660776_0925 [Salegentibacter holothuriorum]|uniref:DUF7281 domain-containing protein n=1 Tax=Salegentibacter holothuriorum TaxID=241145 RepID=A0A1T5AX70_9FLAO|nr:hypothetical protein [Salegentibacter holothuriorum]SKB39407.1 hypothetical protein SAMN05660776_0925 [Salegentibacter holothuriorum]